MTIKRILAVSVCVLMAYVAGSVLSVGQVTNDEQLQEPITRSRVFLEALNKKDVPLEDAYDALLKGSPLDRNKIRKSKLIEDTKRLTMQDYGKPLGIEQITAQQIGEDLAVLRFLDKYEQIPVVWYFTYYHNGVTWVLVTVRFDHEYELLALVSETRKKIYQP